MVVELSFEERDVYFELLDWRERALPLVGKPAQEIVLETVGIEEADLVVLILWHRFETPSRVRDAQTGESGMEQEFRRAYDLYRTYGRPHIFVYRCRRPYPPDEVDGEHLLRLEQFLKGFEADGPHPGLVKQFEGEEDFRRQIRRDLKEYVRRLR